MLAWCLLGVSRGLQRNLTAATESYKNIAEVFWDMYQDQLPSCDQGTFVGTEQARKSALCAVSTTVSCSMNCRERYASLGHECAKETASAESKMVDKWERDFAKDGTLPAGEEAKILEGIVMTGLHLQIGVAPEPGFLSTEKGKSERYETDEVLQRVVNTTMARFGDTTLEQANSVIDACLNQESESSASLSLLSSHLAIFLYCIAVMTHIL